MNKAIKTFADEIKVHDRASGSNDWSIELKKLRGVVAKDKNVTPEQRS